MSIEHFETGKVDGSGTGSTSIGVPVSNTDAAGLLLPSSQRDIEQDPTAPSKTGRTRRQATPANPVYGHIREAEGFRTKPGASNAPKVVKLQDAITISNKLGRAIMDLHQDLNRTGAMHPGLAEARKHLFGDRSLPESHPDYLGAAHHLQQARLFAPAAGDERVTHYDSKGNALTSTDGLAWDSLAKAGPKLMAAAQALSTVSPERAADLSVTHNIEGHDLVFTPTKGFDQITRSKTPFRTTGKTPKKVVVNKRLVPVSKVRRAIAVDEATKDQNISGVDVLRPDLVNAAKKAIRPVKRTRKPLNNKITQATSTFNESVLPIEKPGVKVEPLGKGASDSNKPKKNFREENPTAEKGIRSLGKKGK